eukprot:10164581-Alexandrium_andersonii.AAC.1
MLRLQVELPDAVFGSGEVHGPACADVVLVHHFLDPRRLLQPRVGRTEGAGRHGDSGHAVSSPCTSCYAKALINDPRSTAHVSGHMPDA